MRKRTLGILLCTMALVLIAVCAREEAVEAPPTATTQEIAGTTSPSDVSPIIAQTWLDDVTLGHEMNKDGSIPAGKTGDDFAPGKTIHMAIETTDAPADAAVKVVWFGPGDAKLGEEDKKVEAGKKYLHFHAPDTKSWAKGDYRVEVWVGDERVNTQQFQII